MGTLGEAELVVADLRARLEVAERELTAKRDQSHALETALEDLATHQEELRAQNEELRHARALNEALLERYAALFDAAPVGYCQISERRAIVSANRKAAAYFEAATPQLENKPLHLFVHPESHAVLSRHLDKVLAGASASDEVRLLGREGGEMDCLVQSQPMPDTGQARGACLTTFIDMSQRKQAERALADSELKFRNIFTLAPFGMMTLSGDGRVMDSNEAAQRMLDLSAHELRGTAYTDLLAPDTVATEARRLAEGQPRPGWVDVVEREFRGRGDRRVLTRVTFAIMPDGEGLGVEGLVITEDMTERRDLEARFQHAAKLTLLGEMSASLAHEISQPLNIIRLKAEGALERLKRQGEQADPNVAMRGFAAIEEQVVRLFEVISYMQGLSRRDTGAVQPFVVSRAIQAALTLVDKIFRDDNIVLEVDDQLGETRAIGRQHQLEQVLVNILRNAHDALLTEDSVRLRNGDAPRVRVSASLDEGGDMLRVVLANNGPRVSEDVRQRMFDPFFTTKSGEQGTGLGLSISLGFINEMGGTIHAENTDEGLAFHVVLPRVRQGRAIPPGDRQANAAASDAATPRQRAETGKDRPHVLVVDDEEEAAREIAGFLDAIGYRVTVALNGQQAMEIHLEDPARAVITDLRMPERDGHWLIDRLRVGTAPVFIIIITGQAARTNSELDRLRQRADALLRKPASLRDIVRHLREGVPEANGDA
jgi:PAS domain S-box-containing protein